MELARLHEEVEAVALGEEDEELPVGLVVLEDPLSHDLGRVGFGGQPGLLREFGRDVSLSLTSTKVRLFRPRCSRCDLS